MAFAARAKRPISLASPPSRTLSFGTLSISNSYSTHRLKPFIPIKPRHLHSSTLNLEGDLDNLCKKHMDLPEEEFNRGCSFLHQCALGNVDEIKRRIKEFECNNIVNFRDYDRRSPLHLAASEGHLDLVKCLIEHGARINRSDRWGHSPIDDAYRHRHFAVMEYLREHGGTFGTSSQATNFLAAVHEGDVEEVQTLYELGSVDINAGDFDKRTALHLAASKGNADVIRFLCVSGAGECRYPYHNIHF